MGSLCPFLLLSMGVPGPDVNRVESTAHYFQFREESGRIAEALGKRPTPATGKQPRSESQIKSDKNTRVNIGTAFNRWRQLMDLKEMRFDSELATFLLDW